MMSRFFKILAAVDASVILFCLLWHNSLWLASTQVALLGSLAVIFGSFFGYKRLVEQRADALRKNHEDLEMEDRIDDRFGIFEDEDEPKAPEEILKEEKEHYKSAKTAFLNLAKSSRALFSFTRIAGYVVLIGGFFWLNSSGLFHLFAYLLGFLIVPAVLVFTGFARD